ncbi:MAG: hypothetical protein WDM76_14170 [Limisphaerales bacterium]
MGQTSGESGTIILSGKKCFPHKQDKLPAAPELNRAARTTLPFIYPVNEINGHLLPIS